MTDLTQLLATIQNPETSHVDMARRRAKGTLQWFLEKDCKTHPIHNNNHLEFLICGEEGFRAIRADVLAATRSIDLVLWGFDPAMELERKGACWPRGDTFGDLLTAAANRGVQVRLLIWYADNIRNSHWMGDNLHDMDPVPGYPTWGLSDHLAAPDTASMGLGGRLKARHDYCRKWFDFALSRKFTNLEIRFRKAHPGQIAAMAAAYLPSLLKTLSEAGGALALATHHQKPVLIDYAARGAKANTCAYVMGLNSVTDYWDTPQHLFNEPKREEHAGGAFWTTPLWHVKPYRDYAIRVQGEALYNINENFVQGWDGADGYGWFHGAPLLTPLTGGLEKERASIKPADLPVPEGARSRAQILRTFPDSMDATILKAYVLAGSNAMNYIYVENQYVQLADWTKMLKKVRGQYLDGMKAGGARPGDIRPLHVFVVMPQPERDQMIPNTYDTIAELNAGQGIARYDALVQGQRKVLADPDARPSGPVGGKLAEDSAESVPANPREELNALGMKAAVAMLMTFDAANEAREMLIKEDARDSASLEALARQEAEDNKAAHVHGGQASDVDLDQYSEYQVRPRRYREIYIHSKLMLVDDTFITVGSANLNARSMVGDSEFNICTDDVAFSSNARRRIWANLAGSDADGGDGSPSAAALTFLKWQDRMANNKTGRPGGKAPENGSYIHSFEDSRGEPAVRLV